MRLIIPAALAAVTVLVAPLRAHEVAGPPDIRAWLDQYEAALNARDLDRLARFYHPDVTIYEGGGVNTGWADYRDHHLGPELREMEGLRFTHANVQVQPLGSAGAYVISEYKLRARIKNEDVDATGLETLILVKGQDGRWLIRHSHTSARRRPAPSPTPSPTAHR